MKKPPVTVELLAPSDISCHSGPRPSFNGKEIPPASELYRSVLVPISLKDRQLSKLAADAHRMKNVRPAGRPSGTNEAASAEAAKKLREQGHTWPDIAKKLTNPKYANRSADGWRKLVERYFPS